MKKITIVGVGALGSHVALFLRNEADIKVIDFDRIEAKNTLSQFHGKPGRGKNKAQALAQVMQFMFGLKLTTIPHRLTENNAQALLGGSDLVIDCLDNGKSREIVQGFVRELGIPCLHGALAADGAFGRVVWDQDFTIDSEAGAGAATCEGGEHLPFVGIASTLLARAAQRFLKDGKRVGFEINPAGVVST